MWAMRYRTQVLQERDANTFEAWFDTLRGGTRTFQAWHPLRRYTYDYRRQGFGGLTRAIGGQAFTGTATVQSVPTSRDSVVVAGLPTSFTLRPGDMLSITYGGGLQLLHRVVALATSSAGGVATVPVEPSVVPGNPANAAVQLERPWCNAVISADTVRVQWQTGRVATVTFEARQTLI